MVEDNILAQVSAERWQPFPSPTREFPRVPHSATALRELGLGPLRDSSQLGPRAASGWTTTDIRTSIPNNHSTLPSTVTPFQV